MRGAFEKIDYFAIQTSHQNIRRVSANERLIDDLSESYGLRESTADKRSSSRYLYAGQ